MTEKTINKTIIINAPVSKVWNAITDPQKMKLWLFETEVNVSSDWKVGSPLIFNGIFKGKKFEDKGTILKLETEKNFQYTYWSHISNLQDVPDCINGFELIPEDDQTRLTLMCTNIASEVIYDHWNFYWNITLGILKKVIEN